MKTTISIVVSFSIATMQCAEYYPLSLLKQDFSKQGISDMKTENNSTQAAVVKKTLKNGMTILVRPTHTIPKVSLQIWYNVGSKDEKTGEKGLAHLIEHMIFKGTEKLSESDINDLTHKLSGVCNAFTSYDYTGYRFDMPTQNWKEMLPVIADCMVNCSFKEDHLASEMKAVIQELKMGRDNYIGTLIKDMLAAIFPDHPYHYPIIGYKQDLWNVDSEDLHKFYKAHYAPNNATLVIVGDVKPEEAFDCAECYFGSLIPAEIYNKEEFYWNNDIASKSVTLYREIAQPACLFAWAIPGAKAQEDDVLEVANLILGSGKASRLYSKIVDQEQLATSLETFCWNLFDHGLFFVYFEPNRLEDVDQITAIINEEIEDIVKNGVSEKELQRALNLAQMDFYDLLESSQQQAYEIGQAYLATGSENYVLNLFKQPIEYYQKAVQALCSIYLRPATTNKGYLLPLPATEQAESNRLQQRSDALDTQILSKRERKTPVEPARYAKTIQAHAPINFDYPKAKVSELHNGLEVLSHHDNTIPKVNLVLTFKGKSLNDPIDKQGLCAFTMALLSEGTKKYNAAQFATELESKGISFQAYNGGISISLLKDHLATGLDILHEVLLNATFDKKEIEKIRTQMIADIKNFWDEPSQFAGQLLREKIYANHPYSKNGLGSLESISKISRDDIVAFYKKYINPNGATMAITGDFDENKLQELLEKALSDWKPHEIEDIQFPTLEKTKKAEIHYPINRDQVVLCIAALSIDRKNTDYDKLLLFDQIFGGGVLGSMASRLFQLREATGLFYTIKGSLIAQASEQPGMVLIKTIVSLDRLAEAEKAILETLNTIIDSITPEELADAKSALINSMVNNFESGQNTAQALLFLERYKLPANYFDTRAEKLNSITLDEVKTAARKVLVSDQLLTLKIGRTNNAQQ